MTTRRFVLARSLALCLASLTAAPLWAADENTPRAPGRQAPAELAPSTILDYKVQAKAYGLPFDTTARLIWLNNDSSYQASWIVQVPILGERTQLSQGRIAPDGTGLQPETYTERVRKKRSASLNRKTGQIELHGDRPAATLQAGVQDRLSISLQLGALIAAAPEKFARGEIISLQVTGVSKAEIWNWEVMGEEDIELPPSLESFRKSIHLRRLPRQDGDSQIDIWLAPQLHHLPVRLRLQDGNDFVDQTLESVENP